MAKKVKRVTIDFDEDVYNRFRYHCKKNALKISNKLELLMEDEISDGSRNESGYGSMMKFFKEFFSRKQNPIQQEVVSKPQVNLRDQRIMNTNPVKPIPTIDQLRYRKRL